MARHHLRDNNRLVSAFDMARELNNYLKNQRDIMRTKKTKDEAELTPLSAAKLLVKKTEDIAKDAKVSAEMETIAKKMSDQLGRTTKKVTVRMEPFSGHPVSVTMEFGGKGSNIEDPMSHMDSVLEATIDYARKVSVLFYERAVERGKDL